MNYKHFEEKLERLKIKHYLSENTLIPATGI